MDDMKTILWTPQKLLTSDCRPTGWEDLKHIDKNLEQIRAIGTIYMYAYLELEPHAFLLGIVDTGIEVSK